MNPNEFVDAYCNLILSGRGSNALDEYKRPGAPVWGSAGGSVGPGQKILLCIPHPDDEIFLGALALRLRNEFAATVSVFAYSYGSDVSMQATRKKELRDSLDVLGFQLLESGNLLDAIRSFQPTLLVSPHASDAHPTHIRLFTECELALRVSGWGGTWAQFGYWSDPVEPNFAFEISRDQAVVLVSALQKHKSQISRNPFDATLPAFWANQVRMASERISIEGQGKGATGLPWCFGQMGVVCSVDGGVVSVLQPAVW